VVLEYSIAIQFFFCEKRKQREASGVYIPSGFVSGFFCGRGGHDNCDVFLEF
jgi:hypothetical protein